MNFDALDFSILGPAFLAGLLVLSTHVPLGNQVLSRGIVFIDLAIAQIAALGVIAADMFGGKFLEIWALAAALAGGLLLTFTEKRWPEIQEALIGVLFVLAATGGILLLSSNPHGGEHLKDLLVGQILWVNYAKLVPILISSMFILFLWFKFGEKLGRIGFYLLFAFAVTLSVQLVGVYLVFSSLIVPAIATRLLESKKRLMVGYILGAFSYLMGLCLSALLDLPSGAVIVWVMAIFGVMTAVFLGRMEALDKKGNHAPPGP